MVGLLHAKIWISQHAYDRYCYRVAGGRKVPMDDVRIVVRKSKEASMKQMRVIAASCPAHKKQMTGNEPDSFYSIHEGRVVFVLRRASRHTIEVITCFVHPKHKPRKKSRREQFARPGRMRRL